MANHFLTKAALCTQVTAPYGVTPVSNSFNAFGEDSSDANDFDIPKTHQDEDRCVPCGDDE